MPVIDRRGKPLPEGHPFIGAQIVFGQKRPDSTAFPSTEPPVDPSVETEADGLKAGALRVACWQHQNEQLRKQSAKKKD